MKIGRKTAIACISVILLLYVSAVICAFIDSPAARGFLLTALFLTIVCPAFLYGLAVLLRLRRHHLEDDLANGSGIHEKQDIEINGKHSCEIEEEKKDAE
jgi:ABC-type Fe3+ transport system permease subunit